MLKKIAVDELRLGMHLHSLCGNWADHPFWKARFVICEPADLAKLRDCSILEGWIDTSKGLDVAPPVAAAAAPVVIAARGPSSTPDPASGRGVSLAEELGRAAAVVKQSRALMKSLFQEARMGRAVDAELCQPLVNDITSSVCRNPSALISLARLKTHDDYSYMHSVAVCALMAALSRRLGQSEAQARDAGMAGLLHDMGKAMMPLDVLNKPGKLTEAEFDLMKSHPQCGHELLRDSATVPLIALDVCLHHHERPDGKGYPFGLAEGTLTLDAKMGAVCDVYDAITSNRPYKNGWDPAESISRMSEWSKSGQFDPSVYLAFLKSLGVYPVGSLVRMRSGRLGVVVEQSTTALLQPFVKVFFSTRSNMPIPVELLDTSATSCNDRIAARESNAVWKFQHLDDLWAGPEALAAAAAPRPTSR